jgi:ADP-ribose pyrophosphatase YjhB (NUDIX family)/guanylate kinase
MIIVLSGPSGVSKSYLCWEVLSDFYSFNITRKATTRRRRPNEDDREYVFVSPEKFKEMETNGEFEISTKIYGNHYALLRNELSGALAGKNDSIFVLDVFIAQKFKKRYPKEVILVYIMPIDVEKLVGYIRSRAEINNEPSIERENLLDEELKQWKVFDYVIPFINSEIAYQMLRNIIIAEGCRPSRFTPNVSPDKFLQFRNFPRLAVDLVMINENTCEIALIERWKEPLGWALPGGFVQYGETVEEAVFREVIEETGVRPNNIEFVGIFSDPSRDPRMHVISIAYFARVSDTGHSGGDAKRLNWFALDKIPTSIVFDHQRIIQSAKHLIVSK